MGVGKVTAVIIAKRAKGRHMDCAYQCAYHCGYLQAYARGQALS